MKRYCEYEIWGRHRPRTPASHLRTLHTSGTSTGPFTGWLGHRPLIGTTAGGDARGPCVCFKRAGTGQRVCRASAGNCDSSIAAAVTTRRHHQADWTMLACACGRWPVPAVAGQPAVSGVPTGGTAAESGTEPPRRRSVVSSFLRSNRIRFNTRCQPRRNRRSRAITAVHSSTTKLYRPTISTKASPPSSKYSDVTVKTAIQLVMTHFLPMFSRCAGEGTRGELWA